MPTYLLFIRLLQMKRMTRYLGMYNILFALTFLFLGWAIWVNRNSIPNIYYIELLAVCLVGSIHINRSDKLFIQKIYPYPALIYLSEYLFFSIPLLFSLCCSTYWYTFFYLLGSYGLISCVSFSYFFPKNKLSFSRWLPADNFEWIAGSRQYFVPIIVLYVLATAFLFLPFISLGLLLFLGAIIQSFYQQNEPYVFLLSKELPPQAFLRQKLTHHLWLFSLFCLPILIGYTLFHPNTFWLPLIIYAYLILKMSLFILTKYTLYTPNSYLSNMLVFTTEIYVLLSLSLPFLFPLLGFVFFRKYQSALTNLNDYLDAYH